MIWQNGKKTEGNRVIGVALQDDGSGNNVIQITPYQILPTIDEWKTQLATWHEEGNPFTYWHAIPTEEEAIELPKLPQFKGTTIYEVDTEIKPSGMEVCYYE